MIRQRNRSLIVVSDLHILAVRGFPLVYEGDDVAALIVAAAARAGLDFQDGDVLVVAQKIVSKAEGRRVVLADVTPSDEAYAWAEKTGKDVRLVELVLRESRRVLRFRKDVLIVEHRLGFVHANAGIDQSNVEGGGQVALLLPVDPDASAARIRRAVAAAVGCNVAVLINDSMGRAWRLGTIGQAIGCAGLQAFVDRRGQPDLFQRPLAVTDVGAGDEIAAAASFVMGQGDEGVPVVVVRGARHLVLPAGEDGSGAVALLRPPQEDLFRNG